MPLAPWRWCRARWRPCSAIAASWPRNAIWSLALLAPSIVGGAVGSLLVVLLPHAWFKDAVPWLILAAALLFSSAATNRRWMGIGQTHERPSPKKLAAAIAFQFVVAVYGGYFGAGIGILMLSSLALVGLADIHRMNAVKTLLAGVINGISAIVFTVSGNVHWPFALAMAVASTAGGYLAAHTARRIDRAIVRRIVVTIGFTLAAYYFYRQFLPEPPADVSSTTSRWWGRWPCCVGRPERAWWRFFPGAARD